MRARLPQTLQRLRPSSTRRGTVRRQRAERPEALQPPEVEPRARQCIAPDDEPADPEARVRDAGGPEDHAQYSCTCGYVFRAPVSASVACPHCGTGQAW